MIKILVGAALAILFGWLAAVADVDGTDHDLSD